MSREVDERVVSMKFDNRRFKEGVDDTMKQLEKFDKELQLEGSTKGIKELEQAAGNIKLTGLEQSAEAVKLKFSAMEMAGLAAMQNIVNSAIAAGTKIAKALTIDPVSQGFSKYELKMGAVQTIMASTGETIDTVNSYLQELNDYSDQTIYSFSDMTNSIGKFTNAGVSLDQAVKAIKGISNEAAISGANANEASRAMYNFAQALSSGVVKLIDWKSIENANMATVEFKQQLMDTAVHVGTLVKVGEEYQSVTTDNTGHTSDAFTATKKFNDALSSQWMTSEVLIKTLEQYSSTSTDIGKKAYASAQDVKSFTQMLEVLKESVQSTWSKSFEIIFGDMEEAKELWTGASNGISELLNAMSTARNEVLTGGFTSGWKQFLNAGVADAEQLKSALLDVGRSSIEGFDEMIDAAGGFEKSLKNGWLSTEMLAKGIDNIAGNIENMTEEEFNNSGMTAEVAAKWIQFREQIKNGTIDLQEFRDLMSRPSGRENLIAAISNAWQGLIRVIDIVKKAFQSVFPPNTAKTIYSITESIRQFTEQFTLSDEAAYTLFVVVKAIITPFKILIGVAKLGISIFSSLAVGAYKLVEAFVALLSGGGPIPGLFKKIFGEERYNKLASALGKIINGISQTLSKIGGSIKQVLSGFSASEGFQSTLQWILSILKDLGGKVIDSIIKGLEWIANFDIKNLFNGLPGQVGQAGGAFSSLIERIKSFINSIRDFVRSGGGISGLIANVASKIQEFLSSTNALPAPIRLVITLIQKVLSFIPMLINGITTFISFLNPGRILIGAFVVALAAGVMQVFTLVNSFSKIMKSFSGLVTNISNTVGAATGILEAVKSRIKPNMYMEMAKALALVAASIAVLAFIPFLKVVQGVGALVITFGALVGVLFLMKKALKDSEGLEVKIAALAKSLVVISGSIMILSGAVMMLSNLTLQGFGGAVLGILAITALIALFVGLQVVLKKLNITEMIKTAGYLITYGISIGVFAMSLIVLSKIDIGGICKNFLVLVTIIGLIAVMSEITKNLSPKGLLTPISLALMLLTFTLTIRWLATFDTGKLLKGVLNFMPILLAFNLLMMSCKATGVGALKAGGSLLTISLSIVILTAAVTKLANVPTQILTKAAGVIGMWMVLFGLVAAMSKLAGPYASKAGSMFLKIGIVFLFLGSAIKYVGQLKAKDAIQGTLVLGAVMLLFGKTLQLSKDVTKVSAGVFAITGCVVALVACVALLALFQDGTKLIIPTLSIATLLVALGFVFKMVGKMEADMKTVIATTILIGFALAKIGATLVLLTRENWVNVLASTVGLSLVLLSVTALLKVISDLDKDISMEQIGRNAVQLGLAIAAMMVAVGALALLQFVDVDLKKVLAIELLMGGLIGVFKVISSNMKEVKWNTVLQNLAYLGGAALALAPCILALALVPDGEGYLEKAASLSILMLGLAAVTKVMSTMKNLNLKDLAMGLASAIATVSAVALLVRTIGIFGLDNEAAMKGATTLAMLAVVSPILLALAGIGKLISMMFKGSSGAIGAIGEAALVVAAVIGAIIAILVALGGIASIPHVQELVETGGAFFVSLASAIGKSIGALIGSIGVGLTSGLPEIGTNIGAFGENLTPFVETINSIDGQNFLKTIEAIAAGLLAFAAKDFIDAINIFGDDTTFTDVGEQLVEFGPYLAEFAESVSGIKDEDWDRVVKACDILKLLSDSVPSSGGILQKFFGEHSLSSFGEQLSGFGEAFISFYNSITKDASGNEIVIDYGVVTQCANAASALSELANGLPSSGGKLQEWFGEKNLTTFGEQLESFGVSFVKFYMAITHDPSGNKLTIDQAAIDNCTNAAMALSGLYDNLPSTGGTFQEWFGEKSMSDFGSELAIFGEKFVEFYGYIKDLSIDSALVESVTNAGKMLSELQGQLGDDTSIWDMFLGAESLGDFGSDLVSFGQGISQFYMGIEKIDTSTDVRSQIDMMIDLFKYVDSMMMDDTWFNSDRFEDVGNSIQAFSEALKSFYICLTMYNWSGVDPIATMNTAGQDVGQAFIDGLTGKQEAVKSAAGEMVNQFGQGIVVTDEFKRKLKGISKTILDSFYNNLGVDTTTSSTVMADIGSNCLRGLQYGLTSDWTDLDEAINTLTDHVLSLTNLNLGVESPSTEFAKIGDYCVQGLTKGIEDATNEAVSGAITMATTLLASILNFFGINSPSTVMRDEVGRYIVEGIAEGITGDMSAVEAAEQMAQNICNAFQDTIDNFDLSTTTADLNFQLWSALNPNASDAEKARHQIESLEVDLTNQANKVNIAEAKYLAAVNALGEDNVETLKLKNDWTQAQIDMANTAQSMADARSQVYGTGTDTMGAYAQWMAQFQDALLEQGFSLDEIDKAAQQATGYDPNSPLGRMASQSTDIPTIIDEFMSKATETVTSLGTGVEVQINTTLEEAMANAVTEDALASASGGGSALGDAVSDGFGSSIEQNVPSQFEELNSMLEKGLTGEGGMLGNITDMFSGGGPASVIESLIDTLGEKGTDLVDAGKKLWTNISDGFSKAFGGGTDSDTAGAADLGGDASADIQTGINDTADDLQKTGENASTAIVTGMTDETVKEETTAAGETIATDTATTVDETAAPLMEDAGKNATKGMAKGLLDTDAGKELTNNAGKIARQAYNAAKAALDENSPSKLFLKLGAWATEGMAVGIESEGDMVENAAYNICSMAAEAAASAMEDDGRAPVITPVIDSGWKKELDEADGMILSFDAEGNLVPYGAANTGTRGTGSWLKVDKDTAKKAYAASGNGSKTAYTDDLLASLYQASQVNQGRVQDTLDKGANSTVYNFNQNNYSPKAIDAETTYRNANSLFSRFKAGASIGSSGRIGVKKYSPEAYKITK